MRTLSTFFLLVLFGIGIGSATPASAQSAADRAKRLTIAAADLISKKGLDVGCAELSRPGGRFFQGEQYVVIIELSGVWRCFPPKPSAEGQSALEVKDPDERPLVKDMVAIVTSKGEGWIDYRWNNPATGKIQPKSTYLKRIPGTDLFALSGYYK